MDNSETEQVTDQITDHTNISTNQIDMDTDQADMDTDQIIDQTNINTDLSKSYCIYCGLILTNHKLLDDGGTVVCINCNGWFHPQIEDRDEIIEAHRYNGTGPSTCPTCKRKK